MEVIKELIIAFIIFLILLSPLLILMYIIVRVSNQITPCRLERNIEDILNYYKCFEPVKRKIIKNKLIYEYRYNSLDTHRALVRRFKKIEIELMEEKEMSEEKFIKIENGIGIGQQRQLIEMTCTLSRALTETEFLAIVKIYESVTDRLLKNS